MVYSLAPPDLDFGALKCVRLQQREKRKAAWRMGKKGIKTNLLQGEDLSQSGKNVISQRATIKHVAISIIAFVLGYIGHHVVVHFFSTRGK